MQNKIHQQITGLESMVKERTEELKKRTKCCQNLRLRIRSRGCTIDGGLMERFIFEYKRAQRSKEHLAVVIFDIDNFKKLNDSHGHNTGDMMLKALAAAIATRSEDIHVRWGGEEFVLIFTKVDVQHFESLLNRLIENIHSAQVDIGGNIISSTASVGAIMMTPTQEIAQADPLIVKELEKMISLADSAMYKVKESGKNNFKLYTTP